MKTTTYDNMFFSKTRDFLDLYLEKQSSRSSHTVRAYRDALTVFKRFALSEGYSLRTFGFEDCTHDFMLSFLEYLQNMGYQKTTCNQRLAAIKSYLWYVADCDIAHQQTAISVSHVPFLKTTEKVHETLSDECLIALFNAPGSSRIGQRDRLIMILLYDSAIRLSELLNLRVSDINLARDVPYLRIHGKGDKERIVSIAKNTTEHLRSYLMLYHDNDASDQEYLFYTVIHGRRNQMSPGNVERLINKYAEQIRDEHPDLPDRVHPHMFRRTRATNMYQNDIELELVSRILGHASTQTTRIYARPSLDMIKDAMSKSEIFPDDEERIWPDDEDELARMLGLR